jgi:hypothetical protein
LRRLSEWKGQDMIVAEELKSLVPLVRQAELLTARYDDVVANPPYMGSTGMNSSLKKFAKEYFADARSDLFACFIQRGCILSNANGRIGMLTMDSWMFLSSFAKMRETLLKNYPIDSLVHVGWNCFPDVHTYHRGTACVLRKDCLGLAGTYQSLSDVPATTDKHELFLSRIHTKEAKYQKTSTEFKDILGSPLAYWISDAMRAVFRNCKPLGIDAQAAVGLQTGDNGRFLRFWFEVSHSNIGKGCINQSQALETKKRWFPSNKGGEFRKWYGNHEFILNWEDDGREVRAFAPNSVIRNPSFYFRQSVSWSDVTSGMSSFRVYPHGFIHDAVGHSAFGGDESWKLRLVAYCNTKFFGHAADLINPTIHFHIGYFNKLPFATYGDDYQLSSLSGSCISASKLDWNSYERSWDFGSLPLLSASTDPSPTFESSYTAWIANNKQTIAEMKRLEEENNRLFIDAYGLQDELTPEVPIEQITLTVNPAYRYGGNLSEVELWIRFRQDTIKEFLSYATGCMMGRYSLDQPGLILADFRDSQAAQLAAYEEKVSKPLSEVQFKPDHDGIIPVLDGEWFEDDIVARTREFLAVTFPESSVGENLRFIEESLGKDIRKYFCSEFYKDHLQTYKKRPIYWLVQSPKKGFSCLIYLHRYTKDTLNQVLNNYFRPYLQKLEAHLAQLGLDQLNDDLPTRERTAARKDAEKITKVLKECQAWEQDALLPLAQQRIELDLDDGVKVNYLKLQDVLAPIPGLAAKEE